MSAKRAQHGAAFKARVALAAVKENQTVPGLVKSFQVHSSQIQKWKRQLLDRAPELFVDGRRRGQREEQIETAELYEQIGRLQMELAWLKKKCAPFD